MIYETVNYVSDAYNYCIAGWLQVINVVIVLSI